MAQRFWSLNISQFYNIVHKLFWTQFSVSFESHLLSDMYVLIYHYWVVITMMYCSGTTCCRRAIDQCHYTNIWCIFRGMQFSLSPFFYVICKWPLIMVICVSQEQQTEFAKSTCTFLPEMAENLRKKSLKGWWAYVLESFIFHAVTLLKREIYQASYDCWSHCVSKVRFL